jgi:small subunit ribosomal protein S16
MLKLRLARVGKKKKPVYRLVVSEHTKDMYGNHLEILGQYNPHTKEAVLKNDRIEHWMKVGAQPSDTVKNLLVKEGLMENGQKAKAVRITKKRKAKMEGKKAEAEEKKEAAKAETEKPVEEKVEEAPVEEKKEEVTEDAPAEEVKKEESPAEEVKEEKTDEEKK